MATHGTFEEAALSLLGLDPKVWAPYGIVVYMAVSNQSINFKKPFHGILQQLGLGSMADPGFQLPAMLTQGQMVLLHQYATELFKASYADRALHWSCLSPAGWLPPTLAATQLNCQAVSMDVDEALDKKLRGDSFPPLAWLAMNALQRSIHLACLWALWAAYFTWCQHTHEWLQRFLGVLMTAIDWEGISFDFDTCSLTPMRLHTPATLLQSMQLDHDTLDQYYYSR